MYREISIPFYSTVAASSKKTLVSQRISTPFFVTRLHVRFGTGTENKLKLSFYVSPDDSAPTTAAPTGTNILAQHGHVSYINGSGETIRIPVEVQFDGQGYYLKVYAENSDTFQHSIKAQVSIEIEEGELTKPTEEEKKE